MSLVSLPRAHSSSSSSPLFPNPKSNLSLRSLPYLSSTNPNPKTVEEEETETPSKVVQSVVSGFLLEKYYDIGIHTPINANLMLQALEERHTISPLEKESLVAVAGGKREREALVSALVSVLLSMEAETGGGVQCLPYTRSDGTIPNLDVMGIRPDVLHRLILPHLHLQHLAPDQPDLDKQIAREKMIHRILTTDKDTKWNWDKIRPKNIPTSSRSRKRGEESRRARAHVCIAGESSNLVSSAMSVRAEGTSSNHLHEASSSVLRAPPQTVLGGLPPSATTNIGLTPNPVPSSGQLQHTALDFRRVLLTGSDPPLPRTSKRRRRKSKKISQETNTNTTELHGTPSAAAGCATQSRRSSSAALVLDSRPVVSPQGSPPTVSQAMSSTSANSPNMSTVASGGIYSASSVTLHNSSIELVGPSSSAPVVIDRGSSGSSAPRASVLKEDEVRAANKSLIDSIRAALEFDKDKFSAFKIISKEYRDGETDAGEYLAYVHQFGLGHLTLDLARLCPDPQKQKELIEVYKASLRDINKNKMQRGSGGENSKNIKKGKEKCEESESNSRGEALPNPIVDHLKRLQLSAKAHKDEPPSSNGLHHPVKGKSKTPDVTRMSENYSTNSRNKDCVNACDSKGSSTTTALGGKKKLKKCSKFLKARLGESSASVVPNFNLSDSRSDLTVVRHNEDTILASVRGVWRNGGGRRLVTLCEASPSTR